MNIPAGHVTVARVLHEDKDFATIEVAKHDQVEFTLNQNDEGETIGGDKFLTVIFIRKEGESFETWVPWES